jgi:hypothetical protein
MSKQQQVLKDGAVLIFLPGIRQIRELQVMVYSCASHFHPTIFNHSGSPAIQPRVWPGNGHDG